MAKMITIGSAGNEAKRGKVQRVDTGKEVWDAQTIETPSTPIAQDPGTGANMIIRRFSFELPPAQKGVPQISNEEILNHHKGKIISFLWKDGWEQAGDIRMVRQGTTLEVLVPASLMKGTKMRVLTEKPQTIQQILHTKK